VQTLDSIYAGLLESDAQPAGIKVAAEVFCNAVPVSQSMHTLRLLCEYDARFAPLEILDAYAAVLPVLPSALRPASGGTDSSK